MGKLGSIFTGIFAILAMVFVGALMAVASIFGTILSVVGGTLTLIAVMVHVGWEAIKHQKK